MHFNLSGFLHCQDCGGSSTDLKQQPDKRVVCVDREACELAQAYGDSNA